MQAFFPLPVEFLGGGAVVTLPAEIDIANAPEVTDVLLAVLNSGAGVIADASGTRFCDAAGVGRELALQFAEGGFDLIVAAEDERIDSAARSFAEHGIQAIAVRADLATFNGVEGLYQAIQATGRVPEALAVNAGVGVGGDFARDNDLADELRLIALNVTGAVHLAKRVLPEMIAAGRGGVLFTSSIAATAPARTTRPTPRPRPSCCPSPRRCDTNCGTPA